jgi:hypothetical protein
MVRTSVVFLYCLHIKMQFICMHAYIAFYLYHEIMARAKIKSAFFAVLYVQEFVVDHHAADRVVAFLHIITYISRFYVLPLKCISSSFSAPISYEIPTGNHFRFIRRILCPSLYIIQDSREG